MKPHILIIETPRTGAGMKIFEEAEALGIDFTFLTENLQKYFEAYGPSCFLASKRDYIIEVPSIKDLPSVIEMAKQIHNTKPINGVLTLIDRGLEAAAAVSEVLRLNHNGLDIVRKCLSKDQTREICLKNGIAVPRFAKAVDVNVVRKFVEGSQFPIILKSSRGMGSMEVRMCRSDQELEAMFALVQGMASVNGGVVLVEEFVKGPLYSAETLTRNGGTTILGYTNRVMGKVPSFVEISSAFPTILPSPIREQCDVFINSVLMTIGFSFGACHTEFVLSDRGPVLIEVNARLAGGVLGRVISESFGASIYREILNIALNLPSSFPSQPSAGACEYMIYSDRAGRLNSFHGVDLARNYPGVLELEWFAKVGDKIHAPSDWRGALGQLITEGGNASHAESRAMAAMSAITFEIQ